MMKNIVKFFAVLAASVIIVSAYAADATPALLKDKASFSKAELFDSPMVFADRNANVEAIKAYEAASASYKAEELLPIAVCYMTTGNVKKAKELFVAFNKACPKNLRALRTLGAISTMERDFDSAKKYYNTAFLLGDEPSAMYVATIAIMTKKPDEIAPYITVIKKLAKENIEALNLALIYACKDQKNIDKALISEVVKSIDVRKVIASANRESLANALKIYLGTRNSWTPSAAVVAARGAALLEAWPLALELYDNILKEEPKNTLALRGKALVSYRTGDVMEAANLIKKAWELGDNAAQTDGVELFVLSKREAVWDMFKKGADKLAINPQVRAGLVLYSVRSNENADIFYTALVGENSDILYRDEAVRKLIEEGLEKYKSDRRSKTVRSKLDAVKK